MDRLEAMALALAAVDEGSLAAGARRLGRSSATATRAVAQLEENAGEALLLRSTRSLQLTPAGRRHVDVWRDVLGRLAEVRESPTRGTVAGTLVVTAPELFGRLRVMPVLHAFLEAHPQVRARALLLNRPVDLTQEGVDVAVRLAPLADSSLASTKVGEVRCILCAAPAYLAVRGEPRRPVDLAAHDCIGLNADSDRELWLFGGEAGRERSVQVRTRLSVNGAAAGLDAALRGLGLVRALSYQVAAPIVEGRLVPLLSAYEPAPVPIHLLFRAHPRRWSPTRAFVDHAAPLLRRELAGG